MSEPKFDPDFSPKHPINIEAAKEARLRWDSRKQAYVDEHGFLIKDKFGQPIG